MAELSDDEAKAVFVEIGGYTWQVMEPAFCGGCQGIVLTLKERFGPATLRVNRCVCGIMDGEGF